MNLSRRDFLKMSGAVSGVAMARYLHLQLLEPVNVLNPLADYPDRGWEEIYRNQYAYDSSFTYVCSPNDTHACRLRAFVRNGVILRSETNYDVDKYSDLYGNTATAHWHPRGCKKGKPSTAASTGRTALKAPSCARAGRIGPMMATRTWMRPTAINTNSPLVART